MEVRFLLSLALGAVLHMTVAGVLCGAVAPSDPAGSISPVHTQSEEDALLLLRCRTDPLVKGTPGQKRASRGARLGKNRQDLIRLEQASPQVVRELECRISRRVR